MCPDCRWLRKRPRFGLTVCFVFQQIAEVDKLNAIINLTEKEMLKLRKQYEVRGAMHVRDHAGEGPCR